MAMDGVQSPMIKELTMSNIVALKSVFEKSLVGVTTMVREYNYSLREAGGWITGYVEENPWAIKAEDRGYGDGILYPVIVMGRMKIRLYEVGFSVANSEVDLMYSPIEEVEISGEETVDNLLRQIRMLYNWKLDVEAQILALEKMKKRMKSLRAELKEARLTNSDIPF